MPSEVKMPVVAWRWMPSPIWGKFEVTVDPVQGRLVEEYVPDFDALVLQSDALAAIEAARVEARAKALEEAAAAVEQHDREGREWIPTSLWGQLSGEAAARIRSLAKEAP